MTVAWTREELDAIGGTGEIDIAAVGPDGAVGRATTIWIVRVGDDLYVRSYRGPNASWYRHAQRAQRGVVRAGGIDRAVTFDGDHGADRSAVDDAYAAKYGRSSYVDAMVTPNAAATTLRLLRR
jgi:hypothetical protein